ncbi:hypothetical protein L2E82_35066 [Cichorium intybus]|uniref:Uncharacterized protein n=1 Tax=Cichorium intybus TaxID=13427 RepID=A0ACB9BN72_CICIN|nr:hypothetical protein L2E82_35066 [Cichorium intybus]
MSVTLIILSVYHIALFIISIYTTNSSTIQKANKLYMKFEIPIVVRLCSHLFVSFTATILIQGISFTLTG